MPPRNEDMHLGKVSRAYFVIKLFRLIGFLVSCAARLWTVDVRELGFMNEVVGSRYDLCRVVLKDPIQHCEVGICILGVH